MASFRAHFAFGIVGGVAAVLGATAVALADDPSYLIVLFVATVVGALLPDMDSDAGIPFHTTFGALSLVGGMLAYGYAVGHWPDEWRMILGVPLGTMAVIWGVVGTIFRKLTHHRGIVHSLPAAALSGLGTISVTSRLGFGEWQAFLIAVAVVFGFLIHLVLDELHSAVNWSGLPFVPKQSLGSAFKLFSRDRSTNVLVYALLIALLWGNGNELLLLTRQLVDFFQ